MRVAYVKSGDVLAALERLDAKTQSDDGGPDAFLEDLLRAWPDERFLLLGLATILKRDRPEQRTERIQARSLAAQRGPRTLIQALRVSAALLRFRPDIIICGKCGITLWCSLLTARALKVPLIHSRHNWLDQRSLLGRLSTAVDDRLVRRAAAVLCHGPYLRERLAEIGVARARTFEFDSGNSALVEQARSAAPLPSTDGRRKLLYVGRLVRQKGVFDLLDACTPLFSHRPDLHLVYAGDGSDLQTLRTEIRARGLEGRVELLGRVAHGALGALMRDSLLIVTPTRASFPEGRCMVVMESLALGVPVIAPRFGPFPYLVRHEENGLLYQPDSVTELRAALVRVLDDAALHRQLAAGAHRSGETLLHPPLSYAQALEQALALVRAEQRRPDLCPAAMPAPSPPRETPFFVIGSVRSGTTLVERILNRHPRLCVPPETFYFTLLEHLKVLGHHECSEADLRALVHRYRGERAFSFLGLPPEEADSILLAGAHSYRDVLINLMDFLSRRAGKPRWGEKTPNNLRYVEAIRGYFPAARFILVVRDGRAAVLSRLKHPHWRRNLLGCARHWARDATVMRRLIAEQDPQTLHVLRFEELLHYPEKVVRELCDFLGEAYEPVMLETGSNEPGPRVDYYEQPWMNKSTQAIDPARAGNWRDDYSPRRLRLVESVAGRQLRALGYSLIHPVAPGWRLLYLREQCQDLLRRLTTRMESFP